MRSAVLRAAPALLALALAGCDATLPWTEDPTSGGGGGGSYSVSPLSLTFQGVPGGATPLPKRLTVTLGSGAVYLGVTYSGAAAGATLVIDSSTSAHVDVSVRPPTTAGVYSGTVTITGCADVACSSQVAGSPVVVPVTYDVAGTTGPTAIQADRAGLDITMVAGAADPAPELVALSLQGGGTSTWYTCMTTPYTPLTWLTLTPGSGTALPATSQVAVHGAALPAGTTRSATLIYQTVPCGQAASNVVRVPLTFTVTQ